MCPRPRFEVIWCDEPSSDQADLVRAASFCVSTPEKILIVKMGYDSRQVAEPPKIMWIVSFGFGLILALFYHPNSFQWTEIHRGQGFICGSITVTLATMNLSPLEIVWMIK
jgi:hypothetical protein